MSEAIRAGNIVREQWPLRMDRHLNLYLGNGRCGACFDAYGLMGSGFRGGERQGLSNTHLMHADHWHRGAFGLDYWLPLARLVWAGDPPPAPEGYRQELDLYDGRLGTQLSWARLRLSLATFFHPEQRDVLAFDLRYEALGEGDMPALLLAPQTEVRAHYNQQLTGTASSRVLDSAAGVSVCRVQVGTADSVVGLRVISTEGEARLEPTPEGVAIRFVGERGRHLLLIGAGGSAREEAVMAALQSVGAPEEYAAEAAQAWHRRWGEARIRIPVPEYQALWARSHYYVLCSYAPEVRSPAAPMGWAGNAWSFHFPQDLSYIHPALLRLGHLDIARAWVEFYRESLETMRAYTRRIYRVEGTMWAWEFPIGPDSELLRDGAPNPYQFEIHNAAYPARMARETALHLRDRQWAADVAWPVVYESARFFGALLQRETDGTWGIQHEPSMGQDELGGENAKNYLCALFSARYCLHTALAMAAELGRPLPERTRWQGILADGLAFPRLYDAAERLYATCEGQLGAERLGREKHPIQLNPLTFLPLGQPDEPTLTAYRRRYELCAGVRDRFFHGWTLAAYWVAASHLGDAEGLLHDLGEALPGRYVDADWIQIYESSGILGSPFYVTSHGLALQALNDALVSDYWGEVQVGAACPEAWREVAFTRLRTADGRLWSGGKAGAVWNTEVVDA